MECSAAVAGASLIKLSSAKKSAVYSKSRVHLKLRIIRGPLGPWGDLDPLNKVPFF